MGGMMQRRKFLHLYRALWLADHNDESNIWPNSNSSARAQRMG